MKNGLYALLAATVLTGCATTQRNPLEVNLPEKKPEFTLTTEYFRARIEVTPEGMLNMWKYGPEEAQRQLQRALDEYTGDMSAPGLKEQIQKINQERTQEKLDLIRRLKPKEPSQL
jgi:hypothetical protein